MKIAISIIEHALKEKHDFDIIKKEINVTKYSLSEILNASRNITMKTLVKIIRYTGKNNIFS